MDTILAQWQQERPDLDTSPMAVIGRLSSAARLVDVELRRTFAVHGLDSAAFDVLATLRRSGEPYRLSPGELTRSAMVTSGAITQRLDRLEDRGLVARAASAEDGRGVRVSLTPAGLELIDRALPDHVANEERLLHGLTARQRDDVVKALRVLLESIGSAPPVQGR